MEHLSKDCRTKINKILNNYNILYYATLGEVVSTEHVIDLIEGAKPIRQLPYRAGPGSREVVKDHVEKILKLGVIGPATIPWASPIVLVPKKDGTYRFFVDYRRLN